MSCGCGQAPKGRENRDKIRALAMKMAQKGEVIVFFKCSDYDFTTLEKFNPDGKTEIEYFM